MHQQTVHLFVFDTLSDRDPCYAVAGINNRMFQLHSGRYVVKTGDNSHYLARMSA